MAGSAQLLRRSNLRLVALFRFSQKDCAMEWRAPGKEYEAGSVGVPPT
jgi:hypothetical protein